MTLPHDWHNVTHTIHYVSLFATPEADPRVRLGISCLLPALFSLEYLMKPFFSPNMKARLAKAMGLSSPADMARKEKFKQLAGEDWLSPPDRFLKEEQKIDPELIGRFYGENNLKKAALEVRRLDGQLALRCMYKTRSRSTWSDKSQARQSNGYYSLIVKGDRIGTRNGLNFRLGPDGRYYLGYKNHMDITMKKI